MGDFVVLRRTQSEIDIFGGDVYVDIDGKNVGIVGKEDLQIQLSPGPHTIKMYKSHSMGTFIGAAEAVIEMKKDENLYARYSAPLIVSQPGNIVIAPFESKNDLDDVINNVENSIRREYQNQQRLENQHKIESEKNNTSLMIWVYIIPAIAFLLYLIITMSYLL